MSRLAIIAKTMLLATFISLSFAAPTQAVVADDYTSWKKGLMKKIATKFRYPKSAIRRGIEGRAKVRLNVAADGSITSHEVIEPTGKTVLDRELPKLVARLTPLSAPPADRGALSIEVPITWALQ